jgi:hypothetical protein
MATFQTILDNVLISSLTDHESCQRIFALLDLRICNMAAPILTETVVRTFTKADGEVATATFAADDFDSVVSLTTTL